MSEYIYASSGEPLANSDGEIFLARKNEVVRCMDCREYNTELYIHITCELFGRYVDPDGFCAWGERRERETVEVWNQWSADDVTCSEES